MLKPFQRFVQPRVFPTTTTVIDTEGLNQYLDYTGQGAFVEAMNEASRAGLSDAEIICSFYSKLCYKSLVADGRNANITKTRDIWENLESTFDSAHGSVFEHVQFGFVITDCSRVYTHEQVRHRIGVAYSQTSGRYTRLEHIPLVWDPLLDDCRDLAEELMQKTEETVYLMECRKGLRVPPVESPLVPAEAYVSKAVWEAYLKGHNASFSGPDSFVREMIKWVPNPSLPFDVKKKLTSAIRRVAPNGQANELGYTVNLRSLRHIIQMRTARAAEWEVRLIYNQIYQILKDRYPLIFYGAKTEMVEGALEISGMKVNPYERMPTWQELLYGVDEAEVQAFLKDRSLAS